MAERCGNCGGTEMADVVDNFGHPYKGCARCIISLPPELGTISPERVRLPTPIANLVPMDLRRALETDATVNACFRNASIKNHTREQALTDIVLALLMDKDRLLRALSDAESRRPNVIHLDGDRTVLCQKEPDDG